MSDALPRREVVWPARVLRVALRVPPGWVMRHHELFDVEPQQRRDGTWEPYNDSQDLLWMHQLRHDNTEPTPLHSIDVGWYGDGEAARFRAVVMADGWDNILASVQTVRMAELMLVMNRWLDALGSARGEVLAQRLRDAVYAPA
jgi:hypothetical protein